MFFEENTKFYASVCKTDSNAAPENPRIVCLLASFLAPNRYLSIIIFQGFGAIIKVEIKAIA